MFKKYYCTKCHDVCDYMERKTTIYFAQPQDIDGNIKGCNSEYLRDISGSVCLLCGAILPMNPESYIVHTIIAGEDVYIDASDIINIHQHEVVRNEDVPN